MGKFFDNVYSPVHKVGIGNRFFSIKQTVTTYQLFKKDREEVLVKFQTFIDNLVKESCK